ncbi:PKD domain-containing protein [uncultured Algibacter sp.]|uniref:PKD domain-containing protein n=1 Tax=uncultured Algibacter sp. TaxID=298659 RepID=UPI0032165314
MNSQKTKHLDKSVIYFFVITFLISASVFAYRYTQHMSCSEILFNINATAFRQNRLITFKDNTYNANSWTWDFGDGTPFSTSKAPSHIYKAPGEYTVSLTVNNMCEKTRVVTIKAKQSILDSTKLPKFKIPKSIKVGETLTIKDETENASTWEWRFGETAEVNSNKRIAKYVYKKSGLKTISLIVNGDIKHIVKKRITVIPIQEEEDDINPITSTGRGIRDGIKKHPNDKGDSDDDDDAKPVPYINEADFKNKLILASKKEITASAFSEYFCGDLNKNIIVNGRNVSFLVFCEKIKGKRLRIRNLTIYRDEGSNCIKSVGLRHIKFVIL